jgi:cell division septal protein FtsQ
MATRMRQSLAQIEDEFREETAADRARREQLYLETQRRATTRHLERRHRRGSVRFLLLVLILLATAVLVTVAMFQALYLVMG